MSGIPSAVRDAEALALRALYEKQDPTPTHGVFGKAHSIGTAGMVWQYLTGHRPLNIDVAIKFATALGTTLDAFSPRLATVAMLAYRVATNHMAPAPQNATRLAANQQGHAELTWPFGQLDLALICELPLEDRLRLEGAWLLSARQLGLNLAKRAAA